MSQCISTIIKSSHNYIFYFSYYQKIAFQIETSMLYFVEMHEMDQSPYNYDLEKGKIEWFAPNSAYFVRSGKQIVTNKLKSPTMNCNEDNSNKQTNCLNKFYAKKLGCTLPWTNNIGEKCTGKDKFAEYKNLSIRIRESEIEEELIDQGCIIPNCRQQTWTIESNTKWESSTNQTKTLLQYEFPHYTKVLVRNEIKLYTLSSFVADVGGFLGLLLGESMVSYVLLGTHWMKKLIKK